MGEATGVWSHRELVADEGGAAKKHPEQYISRGNMYHKQYVSRGNKKLKVPKSNRRSW